ncbi:MAG: transposase [Candidatus Enteromonas sp.]
MPEAIFKSLPDARHRLCLVHVQRNISQTVRIRDRSEIMGDFELVYSKRSRKECDEAFAEFTSKWSKPYRKLAFIRLRSRIPCFDSTNSRSRYGG